MLRPFTTRILFEGEPDAGAGAGSPAAADAPAPGASSNADATSTQDGQPTPPAGAAATVSIEGQPDASEPEGAPAGGEDKAPEISEADFLALPVETQDTFIEAYGEQLLERPWMQQHIDRRAESKAQKLMQDRAADPEYDPEYKRLSQETGTYLQQVADMLEGKAEHDPKELAGGVVRVQAWAEATAERGHFVSMNAAVNKAVGDHLGALDAEHPLNKDYQEALQNYDRERNAKTRDGQPDATARRLALPRFSQRVAEILIRAGGEAKAAEVTKKAEKSTEAKTKLARDAGFQKALAGTAARNGAAAAAGIGAKPGEPPWRTLKELSAARKAGTDGLTNEQFIREQDRLMGRKE